MKRLAIIGSVGIPAKYGGFETLTENLVSELCDVYEITVYCSGVDYSRSEKMKTYKGAKLKYVPLKANGIQSIPYDYISIFRALFKHDVLLILGVSGCSFLPVVRLFSKKKIVVNIDGLEWRRKKWKSWIRRFLLFSERMAIRYSDANIADNEAIARYTRKCYGTESHVVAYGGDHAKVQRLSQSPELVTKYPFMMRDYYVKVARIEPENNVEMILQSFSEMNDVLVIVGNWSKNAYGQRLKKEFGELPNIHLLDPIYERKEIDSIRSNAKAYVHGHEAGGTNPSLVEAMNLELPVISYKVSFNVATTEEMADYFSDKEELKHRVKSMTKEHLANNRSAMKYLAKKRYTWKVIAGKYDRLLHSVLSGVEVNDKKQQQWVHPFSMNLEQFESLLSTKDSNT